MGKAKVDFVILVNNTKPERQGNDKDYEGGKRFLAAEIFSQNIKKQTMQEMGAN